jgi:heavy metal translocating P-type ATPase
MQLNVSGGLKIVGKFRGIAGRRKPLAQILAPAEAMHLQANGAGPGVQGALRQEADTLARNIQTSLNTVLQETSWGRKSMAAAQEVGQRVQQIDDAYQFWVRDHIDPIFGQQRYQQQQALMGERKLGLSAEQKQANYSLALGASGLVLAAVAPLLGFSTQLLSIGVGLFIMTPMIKMGYQMAVRKRKFSTMHLMLIYFAGMWFGGYLVIGAAGLVLMAFARKIQMLSESNTHDQLASIFGQQPRTAWMVVDGVETEVPIEQVGVGDLLVIDVGQMIPVDGVIAQGAASIDQHMLTGEAQPVELGVGDPVLAATIVLSGRIFVQVEKTGSETTATQIGEILNNTSRHRLSIQEKSAEMADRSLLPMLIASGIGFSVAGPVGGLAILGCNFTLSMMGLTPLTMLNFLNYSSQKGILVKEGNALEKLHTVDTVLFDKTGTLTIERPHVVQVHTCAGLGEDEVLRLTAAAEHRQTHPVAQAILAAAAEQALTVPKVADAHYEVGYGIKVRVTSGADGVDAASPSVSVGSGRFMQMEQIAIPAAMQSLIDSCNEKGNALVFVAVDGVLVGVVELEATVREEARQVVEELHRRGMKVYIISGDQEAPTRSLSNELKMDGYFANILPEHKADLVTQLKDEGRKVCFVGDGINDAIALKTADVSVSLRGATTAATDTAQVVLMDAHLSQLITLIELVDELHKNLDLNFNVAAALSLVSASGVLFFHAGFAIVEILFAGQFITGVGIASKPLLKQRDS